MSLLIPIIGALALIVLSGGEPHPPNGYDLGETVCDRKSACDLFGCDPECDTLIGDAAPPSTSLLICEGTLPSTSLADHHDAPCHPFTVSATDRHRPDYLGSNADDTFRHVYFRSGDPACVGTGLPLTSGRDCTAGLGNDGQCGYISQGFHIYAVTGQSCSEAGVGLCEGPFCR